MSEQSARTLFVETYGYEPEIVATAPGRVNLIGEHTDYNGGYVFPVSIDRGVWLAASRCDGASQLVSAELGVGEPFDASDVEPGDQTDWTKYPAGMAWALRHSGAIPNLVCALQSTVPMGSGVSSSAALEMAFAVAWNKIANLGLEAKEIAKLGKICENQFVGVQSGIMDQLASACGEAGKAMFIDTRTLEVRHAPIPDDLCIVLLDTKTPRKLDGSKYNERKSECETACTTLGIAELRDTTLNRVEAELRGTILKRARHVVTENQRCLDFVVALEERDYNSIGIIMSASHESLKDDYEVSCPELDAMAEAAWGQEGCVGCRMTGAGFGGACVALVRIENASDFIEKTLFEYQVRTQKVGEAMICQAVQGAHIIPN